MCFFFRFLWFRSVPITFTKVRNEKALAPGGTMPGYVRLHALRLLHQAKWKVEKAINTIATHLEMLNSKQQAIAGWW